MKEAWEVEQIEQAVAVTIRGFEDVAAPCPRRADDGGERYVKALRPRARLDGNDLAFNPIVPPARTPRPCTGPATTGHCGR